MIIGIGTDITNITRIEKLLDAKFITRCFTQAEQDYAEKKRPGGGHIAAYARRFAAKEACAKALGCGIGEQAYLQDIEIINDPQGKPVITLHGAALKTLNLKIQKSKNPIIHLSLSDDDPFAIAYVVIETTL